MRSMYQTVYKAEFLEKAHVVVTEMYNLAVKLNTCTYHFPCDKDGNILHDELCDSYKQIVPLYENGDLAPWDVALQDYTQCYYAHAIVRCICGEKVTLEYEQIGDINYCDTCNRYYNADGILLGQLK